VVPAALATAYRCRAILAWLLEHDPEKWKPVFGKIMLNAKT